jgi:hypothetical protein
MKNKIKELLTWTAILIGSVLVFPLLSVIGILYSWFKHIFKFDYSTSKQIVPMLRSLSLSLDGFACASAGELLNDVLKVKGKIKYGKWYQTLSSVSGLLKIYIKDTWFRKFIDSGLGRNHCIEAITEEEFFYYESIMKNKNILK